MKRVFKNNKKSTFKKHIRRLSSCIKGKKLWKRMDLVDNITIRFWQMAQNGIQQHFLTQQEQRKGFRLTAFSTYMLWLGFILKSK